MLEASPGTQSDPFLHGILRSRPCSSRQREEQICSGYYLGPASSCLFTESELHYSPGGEKESKIQLLRDFNRTQVHHSRQQDNFPNTWILTSNYSKTMQILTSIFCCIGCEMYMRHSLIIKLITIAQNVSMIQNEGNIP